MRLTKIAAAISVLLGLAGGAQAQGVANGTKFGDWLVACEAVTSTRTECRLVQTLTRTEDKSLIVKFVAVPATEGRALLMAQVPIGAWLPAGAVFRPEAETDAEQKNMIWQKCLGPICEAAIVLEPKDLADFTKSKGIVFGYRMDRNTDPVVVRADVTRFEEAIRAIASQ